MVKPYFFGRRASTGNSWSRDVGTRARERGSPLAYASGSWLQGSGEGLAAHDVQRAQQVVGRHEGQGGVFGGRRGGVRGTEVRQRQEWRRQCQRVLDRLAGKELVCGSVQGRGNGGHAL